jgi:precorrin-2/cobalt-factor-2 C20-methyltransferase
MTIILDTLAGAAQSGTLYGIGVGPGDVRYLTLRAAGLVRAVDVVTFFAKQGMPGNARRIVTPLMEAGRQEMRFEYPLTDEAAAETAEYQRRIGAFYLKTAETLAGLLRAGNSVGLLAEGDPFFYGSFMHMWRRLAGEFPVEVVPGVTGMSGCWTSAKTPITWGDDMLAVLPGTLGEGALVERLRLTDAAVIMKVGRHLGKVRRAVERAGLLSRAIYVERGTMENERIRPLAECGEPCGTYFGMVLIPGEGRRL